MLLLAADTVTHALPASSTFEPLDPDEVDISISPGAFAEKLFGRHTMYSLPCEGFAEDSVVHHFTLLDSISTPMNKGLSDWAFTKVNAWLDEEAAGVRCSNEGGFQSHADLFRMPLMSAEDGASEFDLAEREGRIQSKLLHVAASSAIDELCHLGSHVGEGGEAGDVHPACAWINVNRPADCNVMHAHPPERWSAVYYVDAGSNGSSPPRAAASGGGDGDDAPTTPLSHAGHLLFRCGPRRSAPQTSHSFLSVAPTAGSLWLFPGHVPHAVAGTRRPPNGPVSARISVAINFLHAQPPAASEAGSPAACV